MDQGRVVEQGTHESLLAADGLYALMWAAFEVGAGVDGVGGIAGVAGVAEEAETA
jgi:hypothetical protein